MARRSQIARRRGKSNYFRKFRLPGNALLSESTLYCFVWCFEIAGSSGGGSQMALHQPSPIALIITFTFEPAIRSPVRTDSFTFDNRRVVRSGGPQAALSAHPKNLINYTNNDARSSPDELQKKKQPSLSCHRGECRKWFQWRSTDGVVGRKPCHPT